MLTYTQKKQEQLDRADALLAEDKLSQDEYDRITPHLVDRRDRFINEDMSVKADREAFKESQRDKFSRKCGRDTCDSATCPLPKGLVCQYKRYDIDLNGTTDDDVKNRGLKAQRGYRNKSIKEVKDIEACQIGLYIERVLNAAEGR